MNAPKVEALRGAADTLRLTATELAEDLGLPRTPIMAFGAPPMTSADYLLKLARGGPEEYPLVHFLADRMPEPAPRGDETAHRRAPHLKGARTKA